MIFQSPSHLDLVLQVDHSDNALVIAVSSRSLLFSASRTELTVVSLWFFREAAFEGPAFAVDMCVVLIGCGGASAAEIFTCKSWLEQVCCVDVARFTTCCTDPQIQLIGEDWNPVPCPLPSGFLAVPGSRCPALSTFFTLACPPYFFNQPVIIIFVTYNGGVL